MQDREKDATYIGRSPKKRFALILLIALALLVNLLLDPALYRRYESPIACSSKQQIHLIFRKKYPFQKEASFIYFSRNNDGEWGQRKEFAGNPLAVACFNDRLVIFYEKSCSIYDEGKRKGYIPWNYDWQARDALQCGKSLFAFGSSDKDSDKAKNNKFIFAARYDGKDWVQLDEQQVEGSIVNLQAVQIGDLVALFWNTNDRDEKSKKWSKHLRYILFDPTKSIQDGSRWSKWHELSMPLEQIDQFTVCGNGNSIWIFYSGKKGIGRTRLDLTPLNSNKITNGKINDRVLKVTQSYDPVQKKVGAMASCRLGNDIHLFVSDGSIEETVFSINRDKLSSASPDFEDILETSFVRNSRKVAWVASATFAIIVLMTASIAILRDVDQIPFKEEEPKQIELAPIGRRALAYCFDTFALLPSILAVALISSSEYISGSGSSGPASLASEDLPLFTSVATVILSFLYFTICEGKWGQTLGKRLFGIAVVRENGDEIRFRDAILRNLLRVVDECFFMIGLLFVLNTRKFQRIGDLVARTVVIKVGSSATPPSKIHGKSEGK